jgi:hypothetical protein
VGESGQEQFKDFVTLLFGTFIGLVLGIFISVLLFSVYSEYRNSKTVISYTDMNGNINTVQGVKHYDISDGTLTFTDKDGVIYSGLTNYTIIGD